MQKVATHWQTVPVLLQEVEIQKQPGEKLGISIRGGAKGHAGNPFDATDEGVFISKVVAQSNTARQLTETILVALCLRVHCSSSNRWVQLARQRETADCRLACVSWRWTTTACWEWRTQRLYECCALWETLSACWCVMALTHKRWPLWR